MTEHPRSRQAILHRLMPNLHESTQVQKAVATDQRINNETPKPEKRDRAIGRYLFRLERVFNEANPEISRRAWSWAVEALVIRADSIPESYWRQQRQIARDNGVA